MVARALAPLELCEGKPLETEMCCGKSGGRETTAAEHDDQTGAVSSSAL